MNTVLGYAPCLRATQVVAKQALRVRLVDRYKFLINNPTVLLYRITILSVVVLFCATSPIHAQDSASTLLNQAETAAKAVESARYHIEVSRAGLDADRFGMIEADVWLGTDVGDGLRKLRLAVTTSLLGSSDAKTVTVGCDGREYYLIDPAGKTVYASPDRSILGKRVSLLQALVMEEFGHTTPFAVEKGAPQLELRGEQTVGTESCYEVYVKYGNGTESLWSLSKRDHLPRQRIDLERQGSGKRRPAQQRTITNLQVNASFDDAAFKCVVPAGYTKIGESPSARTPG